MSERLRHESEGCRFRIESREVEWLAGIDDPRVVAIGPPMPRRAYVTIERVLSEEDLRRQVIE